MLKFVSVDDLDALMRNQIDHKLDLNTLHRFPAADVVPVVRCGECIHRVNMEHSMDNKEICCGRMAMRVMALDDYCSHGVCMERRQPEGGQSK